MHVLKSCQIEKLLPNVGSLPASAASSPSPWSFPSPWLLSHLGRAVHGPRGWCPVCCLFRTSLVEVVDDCVHFPFDKICSTGSLATCTTLKRTTSASRTNCCHSSVFRCIFPGFMIVHCCVLYLLCVSCLKDSTQPLYIWIYTRSLPLTKRYLDLDPTMRTQYSSCQSIHSFLYPFIHPSIHPPSSQLLHSRIATQAPFMRVLRLPPVAKYSPPCRDLVNMHKNDLPWF